jgi:RHS repeat-associated protein
MRLAYRSRYNKQLQPAMIELGTAGGNASSYYCFVYNYYLDASNPTSCTFPTPGTKNNGSVVGYWYSDGYQTGFNHTASYTYDNVNRLTDAVATGNLAYNQMYSYTGDGSTGQYGNMTCTAGCANMPTNLTFSASSNQITSSGYTYDLAGNLTEDSSNPTTHHTYQWDAEGRVSNVDSGNTWAFTYDAVGDRVRWGYSGGYYDHFFDPSGTWLGVPGNYGIVMQGIRPLAIYGSSETWFHHVNNIYSRTMMTNHAGTVTQDMVFYPWGGVVNSSGSGGYEFADLAYRDSTTNTDLTMNRVSSPNLGRWHSPDPVPGNPSSPQSWNMYSYVANSPTTSIDPLGLQNCPTIGPGGGFACSPEEASQSNLMDPLGLFGWLNWGPATGSFDEFDWFFPTGCGDGSCGATLDFNAASATLLWDTTADIGCGHSATYDQEKCNQALKAAGANAAAVTRALDNWSMIESAALQNGVDPTILAAMGIRESGFQNIPENGYGMYDAGMGIFQIDARAHPDATSFAYNPTQAANYAAALVGGNYRTSVFSGMSPVMALATALHSYNAGPNGLTPVLAATGYPGYMDIATTGGNYVSNVAAIAAYCF